MSFILEGMKKSDAEKRQASGPDIGAVHTPAAGRQIRRFWFFLLLSALAINAAFILWWLRPWSAATNVATRPVEAAASRTDAAPQPRPLPASASMSRSVFPQRTPAGAPPGWTELTASPPAPAGDTKKGAQEPARIPFVDELPPEIRRQIPDLAITLHYYTADAASRLARVNGQILREGESVNANLRLERITAGTLVFRQGDTRFRVGEF